MRKHDRQCTFNVIQCVHTAIVAMEKKYVLHLCVCVCSLSYLSAKAFTPYYIVICGLYGSTKFSHTTSKTA